MFIFNRFRDFLVLNEGRVPKRKHQKKDRSHRDDEKERRKTITEQFDLIKHFLPNANKIRTRQEILSEVRELVWVIDIFSVQILI